MFISSRPLHLEVNRERVHLIFNLFFHYSFVQSHPQLLYGGSAMLGGMLGHEMQCLLLWQTFCCNHCLPIIPLFVVHLSQYPT